MVTKKTAKEVGAAPTEAMAMLRDIKSAYPTLTPDKAYPPLKLKSIESKVSAAEWEARVDCACAYRLVSHYQMDDLVYNHISAKIPGTEHFLLNPFGLMYDEICASSLIKVDLEGNVMWGPEFPKGLGYTFNPAGFVIHAAIHRAKPNLHCIIHTHSLATMAVSSLKRGLLPMTQTSMRFYAIGYHDYEGVVVDLGEQERLVKNLGDADVMFLRNHGVLAVGDTVAQAFNNTYRIERACRTQLMAMVSSDEVVLPPRGVIEKTFHAYKPSTRRPYGLLEWPAMRRLADRIDPSYKL
ncbi:MAG: class II aldolase/adducin family protein [Burkholderiales bacterium]